MTTKQQWLVRRSNQSRFAGVNNNSKRAVALKRKLCSVSTCWRAERRDNEYCCARCATLKHGTMVLMVGRAKNKGNRAFRNNLSLDQRSPDTHRRRVMKPVGIGDQFEKGGGVLPSGRVAVGRDYTSPTELAFPSSPFCGHGCFNATVRGCCRGDDGNMVIGCTGSHVKLREILNVNGRNKHAKSMV